jgi:hypothetical protein
VINDSVSTVNELLSVCPKLGDACRSWLRQCATRREVSGLISGGALGNFKVPWTFYPHSVTLGSTRPQTEISPEYRSEVASTTFHSYSEFPRNVTGKFYLYLYVPKYIFIFLFCGKLLQSGDLRPFRRKVLFRQSVTDASPRSPSFIIRPVYVGFVRLLLFFPLIVIPPMLRIFYFLCLSETILATD